MAYRVALWIAGFLLLCFGYFGPHNDSNQAARIDMAVAIVDHGTFSIDAYELNTVDKDLVRGHYYSNKAPGSGLLAVPGYLLYKGILTLRGAVPTDTANDAQLWYLESFTLVAIPCTLFLLLFFWFLGYFSSSLWHRLLLTLALGLGTIIFPYSQNYFAHVTVAWLLFTAFVLLYMAGNRTAIRGAWSRRLAESPTTAAYLAGIALGAAVLFEYPPAIIGLMIAGYAVVRLPRNAILSIVLGAAPPLFMLLLYNYAVFHNPFTLSYASGTDVSNQAGFATGVAGFTLPSPASWWGMSFSPYRGLFFLSPFLILAFPGFALWRRRGGHEWLVYLVISVGFFLVISMFLDWGAGFSTGPRYIIPLLPFLALPVIFTLDYIGSARLSPETRRGLYGAVFVLVFISVLNVWSETVSTASYFWPNFSNLNPLFSADLPSLLHGEIIPNQGSMRFGLGGLGSLLLLAIVLAAWTAAIWMPEIRELASRQAVPSVEVVRAA